MQTRTRTHACVLVPTHACARQSLRFQLTASGSAVANAVCPPPHSCGAYTQLRGLTQAHPNLCTPASIVPPPHRLSPQNTLQYHMHTLSSMQSPAAIASTRAHTNPRPPTPTQPPGPPCRHAHLDLFGAEQSQRISQHLLRARLMQGQQAVRHSAEHLRHLWGSQARTQHTLVPACTLFSASQAPSTQSHMHPAPSPSPSHTRPADSHSPTHKCARTHSTWTQKSTRPPSPLSACLPPGPDTEAERC